MEKQKVRHAILNKIKPEIREAAHTQGWVWMDGKKLFRITIPHGGGDLPPGTLNQIINQTKLCKSQFIELVKCPFRGADYYAKISEMKEQGLL